MRVETATSRVWYAPDVPEDKLGLVDLAGVEWRNAAKSQSAAKKRFEEAVWAAHQAGHSNAEIAVAGGYGDDKWPWWGEYVVEGIIAMNQPVPKDLFGAA